MDAQSRSYFGKNQNWFLLQGQGYWIAKGLNRSSLQSVAGQCCTDMKLSPHSSSSLGLCDKLFLHQGAGHCHKQPLPVSEVPITKNQESSIMEEGEFYAIDSGLHSNGPRLNLLRTGATSKTECSGDHLSAWLHFRRELTSLRWSEFGPLHLSVVASGTDVVAQTIWT